jgi:hypothetical protein
VSHQSGYRNVHQVLHHSCDFDIREFDWYNDARNEDGPHWSHVYKSDATEQLGLTAYYPIRNESGHFFGVFAVDFHLSLMSHYLQTIAVGTSGKSRTLLMADDGHVIGSSTMEYSTTVEGILFPLNASAIEDESMFALHLCHPSMIHFFCKHWW